jgi:murein DD-endopeptidase MepM/ murein hydrolase activator NlpD
VAPAELPQETGQGEHDAAFLRDGIAQLAGRVGALQARLSRLEALTRRFAGAAGYAGNPPLPFDFAAAAAAGGVLTPVDAANLGEAGGAPALDPGSAQALGQRLDALLARASGRLAGLQDMNRQAAWPNALAATLPVAMPVAGYPWLSSPYGKRRHPVTGLDAMHHGVDLAAPAGTPILAAAAGLVRDARQAPGYGKWVEIDHGGGYISRYAHASSLLVQQGDWVSRGQLIARVGSSGRSTGPHLHFEVRLAGQTLDPRLFIARQATAPPAPFAARAALD